MRHQIAIALIGEEKKRQSQDHDSPAEPSATSQGELIGCRSPTPPPALSVPWTPTPASVLTRPSDRSICVHERARARVSGRLKKGSSDGKKSERLTFRMRWFSVSAT